MAVTLSGSVSIVEQGLRIGSVDFTIVGENMFRSSRSVAASTTNELVTCEVDYTDLLLVYIHGDQDFTLKTEDSTTPEQTFTFVANEPILWTDSSPVSCPFTTSFDNMYVTTGAIPASLNLTIILLSQ